MSFNYRQDIGSPGFVYDKIYTSYAELRANQENDGISIGRYVIILYPREYSNNQVKITQPDADKNKNVYYDTAIFQKQYISQKQQYEFITFLGVFEDNVPQASSVIMTSKDNDLLYVNSNQDNWIFLDTSENIPKFRHINVNMKTEFTGKSYCGVTGTQTDSGYTFTVPSFCIDKTGHVTDVEFQEYTLATSLLNVEEF